MMKSASHTDSHMSWVQAIPLGLQHMVAMIVGCITVPIIIANAAQLPPGDSIIVMQASIITAGISIFIQSVNIKGRIGSGLPFVVGSGFAFISTMTVIASTLGVSYIWGASLIGAMLGIVFGLCYKWLKFLFAPIVKATVVVTIGITLYKVAVGYMAGGPGTELFGQPLAWGVSVFTMIVTLLLTNFGRGILKTASTLFGLLIGYVVAFFLGLVSFANVWTQPFFQLLNPLHFGLDFSLAAVLPMAVVFLISSIEAMGQMEALAHGALGRSTTEKEITGGIVGINLGCILGALLGGVPNAAAGQNVGITVQSGVTSKKVYYVAGAAVICVGLFPQLAALCLTIPLPVLGGATIAVFGSIAMTGIRVLVADGTSNRNMTIMGLSLALAIGVSYFTNAYSGFPAWVNTIFGNDVVVAALVSIVLNLVLPREKAVKSK